MDPGQVRDVAYLAVAMLLCAVAAIGYLFRLYDGAQKERLADALKQRDAQLEINKSQAAVSQRIAERLDDLVEVVAAGRKAAR